MLFVDIGGLSNVEYVVDIVYLNYGVIVELKYTIISTLPLIDYMRYFLSYCATRRVTIVVSLTHLLFRFGVLIGFWYV